MDCPSEENIIRMKLEDISGIENLEFDIANRKLTVFHYDVIDQIEKSVIELNLGGIKISSEQTQQIEFNKDTNQKKLLWSVFVINFAFFKSCKVSKRGTTRNLFFIFACFCIK